LSEAVNKLSNRLEQDAAVDIIKHDEHNKATHADVEAHAHEQFSDPNEPLLREFAHKWQVAGNTVHAPVAVEEPRTSTEICDEMARTYLQPPTYYVQADPWYYEAWRYDVAGSCIFLVGSLMYNFSSSVDLYKDIKGHYPNASFDVEWWLIKFVNAIGAMLFVLGSWLYWKAAHRTFAPIGPQNSNLTTWWITLSNFMGALCLVVLMTWRQPLHDNWVPHGLNPRWIQMIIGNVVGNIAYLFGTYLMIVQLATEADSVT
jgi:hypothetical protein